PLLTSHFPLPTSITWDATKFPAGIYFLIYSSGTQKITQKLIILK
ncbi:T9SS type A sorting domain-containing protein, partial [candidate division WOR-3 bacterium]|nr:T9SS type A sorting domain-containing protein [candidate division WOR-3 bacterium]